MGALQCVAASRHAWCCGRWAGRRGRGSGRGPTAQGVWVSGSGTAAGGGRRKRLGEKMWQVRAVALAGMHEARSWAAQHALHWQATGWQAAG